METYRVDDLEIRTERKIYDNGVFVARLVKEGVYFRVYSTRGKRLLINESFSAPERALERLHELRGKKGVDTRDGYDGWLENRKFWSNLGKCCDGNF